ncbi:MAG: tripartite tricarboxylate transporter TctB family protein [Clostridiaceae bacterium]
MKKIIPILSIITGCYWVIYGFKYGFWIRKGPGGGFLPVISGILAVIFAILVLTSQKNDKDKIKFNWKAFLPVIGVMSMLLISYLLGLILAIAIYVFLWLKYIEKYKTSKSLIIGSCCSIVVYGIFVLWLSVPLPTGILGLL